MPALSALGAARFHGWEDVLAEKVVGAVEAAGHPCRVGIADGLLAGQPAAWAGLVVPPGQSARFLAPFPVAELAEGKPPTY